MQIQFDPRSVEDYRRFLAVKALPKYRIVGRTAEFPDEYQHLIGGDKVKTVKAKYAPIQGLFDYQEAIARLAIDKRKFAVFAQCGLGKTLILLEFARHANRVLKRLGKKFLIVSPLMVVKQTLGEAMKWYGKLMPIERVSAAGLSAWLTDDKTGFVGITNYEALTDDTPQGNLGGLGLDESSMLKSHYGKWGASCIRLGKGLDYKLALTGTPAPNDRIEYANHAVFLDAFPTVNSFLAKFFVNRGQTDNRWELKPHALRPFYRALSHWCIFLENPATYGWADNTGTIPPINVHIHDVELTEEQQAIAYQQTGTLFADQIGGITSRSVLSQMAKGNHKGAQIETLKPAYIKGLVDQWPDESTIIWCLYNAEQELMERTFPGAASLKGDTPYEERERLIEEFKAGKRKVMIGKSKVIGWGLNLERCTRMVFSGIQDSYETWHQCIKRANRIGATRPLNVHVPLTQIERAMFDTVLRKAHRIQLDTTEQESIFKEIWLESSGRTL